LKIDLNNKTAIEIYKLVLERKLYAFPRYFWNKPESLKEAGDITRFLFEQILNWNENDIKEKIEKRNFY